MINEWIYTLSSVILVSLISFVGLLTISMRVEKLKKILIYMVSFSAGALLGDAFIHLLPEAIETAGYDLRISVYLLLGILFSFIVEKIIHWRHCHIHPKSKEHVHPFAILNLLGDGVHNFIDGLIIGASYLASLPVGIATTIAVILHEIPQEIGDFGVLLHGGFSKEKALFFNFLTATTAILGAIASLFLSFYIENLTNFLIPFAAGGFIYIASSDFIPELHKEIKVKNSLLQFIAIVLGILVMIGLLYLD
ncbi:ZIP family metal transporter [Candidatus Woesearchaeota archaeon]|nr:ZIP family metal transporter [Candidatus Woesearchaeota archaeon]